MEEELEERGLLGVVLVGAEKYDSSRSLLPSLSIPSPPRFQVAAHAIQSAWRYHLYTKRGDTFTETLVMPIVRNQLLAALHKWKSLRRNIASNLLENDHMINSMIETVFNDVAQLEDISYMLELVYSKVYERELLEMEQAEQGRGAGDEDVKRGDLAIAGRAGGDVEARIDALSAKVDGVRGCLPALCSLSLFLSLSLSFSLPPSPPSLTRSTGLAATSTTFP